MAQHEESGIGTAVIWGVVGLIGYWVYTSFFSSSTSTAATAPPPAGGSPAVPPSSTSGGSPSGSTPPAPGPAAPAYAGPSLDQMYTLLQSAVVAAFANDPALSCPASGVSGLGIGPRTGPAVVSTDPSPGFRAHADRSGFLRQPVGKPTCPAAQITASYDVFSYYLLQAVPSIKTAPAPPDHSSLTLSAYWQWASGALQAQIPGLSGLGNVIGGLGAWMGGRR